MKKLMALIAALATILCTVPGRALAESGVWGDADGNGAVNHLDIVRVKSFLANRGRGAGTSAVTVASGADADGNGALNNRDVVRLKNYLANYDEETRLSTVCLGPEANNPFGWIWPLPLSYRQSISQYFKGSDHSGLDIQTYRLDGVVPALAISSGTVTRCGSFASWGNLVVVRHSNGWYSYYAHLHTISVELNQTVTQGQQLGLIGQTGDATGPHLHLVVAKPDNKTRLDPLSYIPRPDSVAYTGS